MNYTDGLLNIFIHIELNLFNKAAFMDNLRINLNQPHEIPDTGITRKQLKTLLLENALLETRNNFNVYRYKVGDIYRKTWATYRKMNSARRDHYKIYSLTFEQIHVFLENFDPSRPHEIHLSGYLGSGVPFKLNSYYKQLKTFTTTYEDYPISVPICDVEYIKLLDEKKILKLATKPVHKQWVSYDVLEQYLWKTLTEDTQHNITIPHLDTEIKVVDYDFLNGQVELENGLWVYLNAVEWVKFTTDSVVKILKLNNS